MKMKNQEPQKEETSISSVLPKEEICPNGYDDCSGCGSCDLYKYYLEKNGNSK
jgi:hypothetical protein